ncbi:hypothetical protein M3196_19900 [Fictibacillus nanhaiensis]|jgi:hypothetical protein|uniref:hypothetical protein n=1 Tax=Fictibacillus nanhaiensis TaxID=742169 RepID=UPI00203EABE7|nr:hypothetical protein [Fictibacillus nanhaiensis]MCM3733915.1 hypothetical protein [Fictibacillus nanhaiensis]
MKTLSKPAPHLTGKPMKKKKLTKEQYRDMLLRNYAEKDNFEFDINKVNVSKNDPVLSTVNNILTSMK